MTTSFFGVLAPLFADATVTDILVNGGSDVWVERAGTMQRVNLRLSPGQIEHLVERALAPLGVRVDAVSPIADARLPDGSRIHVIVPPVSPDGMCVSIRRFRPTPFQLGAFAPPEVVRQLHDAVVRRANIVVSGPTSSGKTTLLNALAASIGRTERIVTIEDAAELRLPGDHVVRLEARRPTAEGIGETTIRDLVRAALRMRPDRLVIGEVRGPEALDMLQALNTGHDGSLTTCHANSALDALHRLDTMALLAGSGLPLDAVQNQVQRAIDLVVHVVRGSGGQRQITSVSRTTPSNERLAALTGVWPGRCS